MDHITFISIFHFSQVAILLTHMVLMATLGSREGRYTCHPLTGGEAEIWGIKDFSQDTKLISKPELEIRASF